MTWRKLIPRRYYSLKWDDDGTGYEQPLWRWLGRDWRRGEWRQNDLWTVQQ